ncbi:MAG TPA: preprotein translocase subunit YajC [Candidatus Merdivicinus excrementipullorum]|uniref:Preprotein translocase subunit YajC n=1 Tax=Candidatus Merdivicinus excrementipullorum TaxID=2840867 RepID=A0A9D1FQD8_9FIRM|nr:preprotein translocase subunit YajC [Candidatus Merdivicinus excrementipullorum]
MFTALLETTANTTQSGGWLLMLVQLLPIVLIVVVMYFILIRPQRKRDKEMQKMRNSLQVGDEVTTSGGIIGRVVSLREDTVVIETGSDRSKIRIKRWAIQSNETLHDEEA